MTLRRQNYFSVNVMAEFPLGNGYRDAYVGAIGYWTQSHVITLAGGWFFALIFWLLVRLFLDPPLSTAWLLQRPFVLFFALFLATFAFVLVEAAPPSSRRSRPWMNATRMDVDELAGLVDREFLKQTLAWTAHTADRIGWWMRFWSPLFYRAIMQNKDRRSLKFYYTIEFFTRVFICFVLSLLYLAIASSILENYSEFVGSVFILAIVSAFVLSLFFDMSMPRVFFSLDGMLPWRYKNFLRHAVELKFMYWNGRNYAFIHNILQIHFAQLDPSRLFSDEPKETDGEALFQRRTLDGHNYIEKTTNK